MALVVEQAGDIVHAAGGLLHVDGVQSAGKISCDINALGADILTITAHKLGGPKGVGALVKARESLIVPPIRPIVKLDSPHRSRISATSGTCRP